MIYAFFGAIADKISEFGAWVDSKLPKIYVSVKPESRLGKFMARVGIRDDAAKFCGVFWSNIGESVDYAITADNRLIKYPRYFFYGLGILLVGFALIGLVYETLQGRFIGILSVFATLLSYTLLIIGVVSFGSKYLCPIVLERQKNGNGAH